eukprot:347134_1
MKLEHIGTVTSLLLLDRLFKLSTSCQWKLLEPHNYKFQESIKITVNKYTNWLFDPDYNTLPFCKIYDENVTDKTYSGEILTPYEIKMLLPKECDILCKKTHSKQELQQFVSKIEENYRINLIADGLPAAQKFKTLRYDGDIDQEIEDYIYEIGYPLGIVQNIDGKKSILLYNHIDLVILISERSTFEGTRIVGFEVQPRSKAYFHNINTTEEYYNYEGYLVIADGVIPDSLDIIWSYSVLFEESSINWTSRWNAYAKTDDVQSDDSSIQIHWQWILIIFVIVVFVLGLIIIVYLKRFRHNGNENNSNKEMIENFIVDEEVYCLESANYGL